VVVATGDQNRPRMPALAGAFPGRVAQVHPAGDRAPGQLPDGAVLVVGSAQSGCQITEDLLAAGRRVILATSRVGRLPFRHRGRETVEWLVEAGLMDRRPVDLPDPSAMTAAQPLLAPGRGLEAPPAELDEHDLPVDLDPPASVDLRAEQVASVVWCTGFGGDFSFIDPALVGADGTPCRQDAAGPVPGLW
jgi:NAD(P)-dependent dehydrogenase (short-subunit alcohol dehydrogenase family)